MTRPMSFDPRGELLDSPTAQKKNANLPVLGHIQALHSESNGSVGVLSRWKVIKPVFNLSK
jgi:hypothetical protein